MSEESQGSSEERAFLKALSTPGCFWGEKLTVAEGQVESHARAYPLVDLMQEYRIMDRWLQLHPRRRGTIRFVDNWLKKEQRKAVRENRELRVGMGPSDWGIKIHVNRKKI